MNTVFSFSLEKKFIIQKQSVGLKPYIFKVGKH